MNYVSVGFGRMGRAVDRAAGGRGHHRVAAIDPHARERGVRRRVVDRALQGADVAFEFTLPSVAPDNVERLLRTGVPVVCGTTGWSPGRSTRQAARDGDVGAVIAPNFSIGMNLFFEIAREAARRLGAAEYAPWIWEHHHAGKADAPGGSAMRLAEVVARADPSRPDVVVDRPEGTIAPGSLHVAATRAGNEPGTHVVGFDGEFDSVELRHRARGRDGFAFGAVLAGEWLVRTGARGVHTFAQVVRDVIRAQGGRR